MKIIGISLIIISVILLCIYIGIFLYASWQYENTISNSWGLAEKASTIDLKSDYIDKFVKALEESKLQGTNAYLIFKTPYSSFDQNMITLKSLQSRLQEIKTLDINSFAYQTAIQQITAQEQGEANRMLEIFSECWLRIHYVYLWSLYGVLVFIGILIIGGVGATFIKLSE